MRDPVVDRREDRDRLVHRIPDVAAFDRRGIEIAKQEHVVRREPEPGADGPPLRRVHHHDQVGLARERGRENAREVSGEVHAVAPRGLERRGG
jgi:hypothetical protein